MSYKKALKKLENLPVGERQLAAGQYVWEVKKGKSHCGCAIGKLLTERQRLKLFRRDVNAGGVDDLRADFLGIEYDPLRSDDNQSGILDLTHGEANLLQSANDGFSLDGIRNSYPARKARYKHVIAWLKEQLRLDAAVEAI